MAVAEDRRYNAEGGLGGTDITRNAEYNIALSRVRLEKRYASVAAESMLRKNDPDKEPTAEQISKCADRLRKDERFSAFIKEKEGKLSEYDEFQNAMKELDKPEKRTQFLMEMGNRVLDPEHQINNGGPVQERILN